MIKKDGVWVLSDSEVEIAREFISVFADEDLLEELEKNKNKEDSLYHKAINIAREVIIEQAKYGSVSQCRFEGAKYILDNPGNFNDE